ncbi:MAG: DUF433 domain-containing protein [Armatimonadetes bacterium]|nr:DUF433 domain-containing protein [Armatimonadota bacterium]
MAPLDRIQVDPNKMNGQPCIRNTRLTVRRVLEIVALYKDHTAIAQEFPEIEEEDIRQAILFAAANLPDAAFDISIAS